MKADINDYAMIGDCETAALVHRSGSIDWLCWPRFDSQACFAALVGKPENGAWRLAPVANVRSSQRRYRPDTLILETTYETATGTAQVIDFMPLRKTQSTSDLLRIVVGKTGTVRFRSELHLAFDYGRLRPLLQSRPDGVVAIAGPHAVRLSSQPPTPPSGDDPRQLEFEVKEGETRTLTLAYFESHAAPPDGADPMQLLSDAEAYWREWAGRCSAPGPWTEAVKRSLITLKALTYRPTGGLIAAPTTSLPETLGGVRNWDYRYCWLRDATFTLLTLLDAGYRDEAVAWRDWLLRAVAGDARNLQPLYGVAGEQRLIEWEADWLEGFAGSRPVRIGNAAFEQYQLDVYGEVLDALHQARRAAIPETEASWALQQQLLEYLEGAWDRPDDGIWEVRSGRQRFTQSQVMAWVGFDRGVKAIERSGLAGPLERWRAARDNVHAEVCRCGYDEDLGAFTQAFGSDILDASTLLIPLVGFLPATDPRVVSNARAIQEQLSRDGLVYRYDTKKGADGLPPGEGAFLACSFWLADNLVLMGCVDEGQRLFERLLDLRNDVGLLAEEYDPVARRALGNFPQALSHLALVDTAYSLTQHGPALERGESQRREARRP